MGDNENSNKKMWLHQWIYLILLLLGIVTGAEVEKLGESGGPPGGAAKGSARSPQQTTYIDLGTTTHIIGEGATQSVHSTSDGEPSVVAIGESVLSKQSEKEAAVLSARGGVFKIKNEDSKQQAAATEAKEEAKDEPKEEEKEEEEPSLDEIKAMKMPASGDNPT